MINKHDNYYYNIADFVCKELMLVIEVDGITHQWEETIRKDEFRQKALEAAGFTVLRFNDEEVLNNIQVVYNYLEDWIERRLIRRFDRPGWSTPE